MNVLHEKYRKLMECKKQTPSPTDFTCHRRCKEEEEEYYKNAENANYEYTELKTTKIPCKIGMTYFII